MREDWYNIKNIASETWHVAKRLKRGHCEDLSYLLENNTRQLKDVAKEWLVAEVDSS